MTVRVMLDIETLGTTPGSPILSIGAVPFGPGRVDEDNTFEARIDPASCDEVGLVPESETAAWWANQSYEARREAFMGDVHIRDALKAFNRWCHDLGPGWEVWAKGPGFDCTLLEAAYDALGKEVPWHFTRERCVRTLDSIVTVQRPSREGTAHSALDDAMHQARVAAKQLALLEAKGL